MNIFFAAVFYNILFNAFIYPTFFYKRDVSKIKIGDQFLISLMYNKNINEI